MVALAGCNPVAFGKWFDSTVPHEEKQRDETPMKSKTMPVKDGPKESEGR